MVQLMKGQSTLQSVLSLNVHCVICTRTIQFKAVFSIFSAILHDELAPHSTRQAARNVLVFTMTSMTEWKWSGWQVGRNCSSHESQCSIAAAMPDGFGVERDVSTRENLKKKNVHPHFTFPNHPGIPVTVKKHENLKNLT